MCCFVKKKKKSIEFGTVWQKPSNHNIILRNKLIFSLFCCDSCVTSAITRQRRTTFFGGEIWQDSERTFFTTCGFWMWLSKSYFSKCTVTVWASSPRFCSTTSCVSPGAQQRLAFRSCFVGGKRGERWRRARRRTSGDPRSKWSTKAIATPGLWYVLGGWHHWSCGVYRDHDIRKEGIIWLCRKTIKCFLPESRTKINTGLCLCVNLGSSYANLGLVLD